MENINDPYEFLDFGIEEAEAAEEKISKRGRLDRDRRICACGHPMKRHWTDMGKTYCKPSKLECPCRFESHRAVLIAADTRRFLCKTVGPGPEHALARGILASVQNGEPIEWVIDMKCGLCGAESRLTPTPIQSIDEGRTWRAHFDATGYDALLCGECTVK